MQFPYVSEQRMEFEVELKEPALVKINLWLWLIVCPGDEIHADIHYSGKITGQRSLAEPLRRWPSMKPFVTDVITGLPDVIRPIRLRQW